MIPYGSVILEGVGVAAVWLTAGGIGAMIGNCAAVVEKRSPEERADWTASGWALGCAFGFFLMICAIAALERG